MNVQQFLQDKYNRKINLSELQGCTLKITTVSQGIIKGVYQYAGLHYNQKTCDYKSTDIIVLTNVESDTLSKAFFNSRIPANEIFHILPDDIADISIL